MTDLQTAMAGNSELEGLVRQAIVSQNDIDILTDQIIYAWAGVSNIVSGSRGVYIDARQLAVLEAATGENYLNTVNSTVNPLINASLKHFLIYRIKNQKPFNTQHLTH